MNPATPQRTLACAALVACVAASTAVADVTSIDEFIGDATENFENIMPPGSHNGPMPIFEGAGTFNDSLTNSPWIANSLNGGGGELLLPYNGNLMGLAPTGWTEFTFDTPVHQFGGYFGAGGDPIGGSATFYDAAGGVIESVSFAPTAWQWEWHGWESDVAFSSVVIHTGANPGITTVYDDLQITYTVPAPGAAIVLLIAGAAGRRRRA